jgi:DNA helicase-2/ATP-dependent DNA helicase PcrA
MEEREKLDRYKRQLEVYAHIVEEKTGYQVSRMHLYYTGEKSGTPYISYDYSKKAIDNTIKTFDNVVNLIESKDYDMRKVKKCEKLCGNCDFRFYCNYK